MGSSDEDDRACGGDLPSTARMNLTKEAVDEKREEQKHDVVDPCDHRDEGVFVASHIDDRERTEEESEVYTLPFVSLRSLPFSFLFFLLLFFLYD